MKILSTVFVPLVNPTWNKVSFFYDAITSLLAYVQELLTEFSPKLVVVKSLHTFLAPSDFLSYKLVVLMQFSILFQIIFYL